MVGRHHQQNGHEFEQTLWNSKGQGGLVCCSPWGHRFGLNLVTEQQVGYQMLQTQKNNLRCHKLYNNPSVVFDFVNTKGFLISSLSSTWRPIFNGCEHLLFFTEIMRTKSLLLPNFHFERNKLRFHPDVSVLPWCVVAKNLPADVGDIEDAVHPWVRKVPWRRKWQWAPVSLPGKSHGQRSLVDYSWWDLQTWLSD